MIPSVYIFMPNGIPPGESAAAEVGITAKNIAAAEMTAVMRCFLAVFIYAAVQMPTFKTAFASFRYVDLVGLLFSRRCAARIRRRKYNVRFRRRFYVM